MNEIEKQFTEQLQTLCGSFTLDDHQLEQLRIFFQNLVEWNKVMNLTTITEEKDVYTKHFLDSLSLLRSIPAEKMKGRKLMDVGTGAGFPGLVLAIAVPKLQVVLMDSLNKRIRFLNDTLAKVGVTNAIALHARAEELARQKEYREQFDLVTSRAVANLSTLCEYDLPFVRIGGIFVSYKAEKAEEETKAAGRAISILGGKKEEVDQFTLPGTDYERSLIVVKKVRSTPGHYPRKAGTPSKEPL